MTRHDVTGFILAGGRSSRMGRDKSLLPLGSGTLIDIVSARLQSVLGRVVVIGHPDNAPQLAQRLAQRVLTDVVPHEGPLMGIFTGLLHTHTALNVFVPCDMPWIEERLLDRLMATCSEETPVVASLHPHEGVQPFPLICHRTASRLVGALLNQHERSLRALLGQPRTRIIQIPEMDWWRSFTNVNTLSDYARLSKEMHEITHTR